MPQFKGEICRNVAHDLVANVRVLLAQPLKVVALDPVHAGIYLKESQRVSQ